MNSPRIVAAFEPPPLDAEGLMHVLHMHGFQPEDRAAVRAFGRVVRREELEADFLDSFLTRESAPSMPAAAAAEARFCDELLNVCDWDGSPGWFNRLARQWCICRDVGVDERFVWVCTGALLSACRERLVGGRAEVFQLELDLLTGLVRVVWALAAHLSSVGLVRERTLATVESEEGGSAGLPGRVGFDMLLGHMAREATAEARLGLMIIRLQAAPARAVLMPAERDLMHRMLHDAWREVLREDDVICLVGEHEWALLQPRVRTPGQVVLAANKLREVGLGALARVGMGEGIELMFGSACAPDHGADAEALERAARDALHAGGRTQQHITMFGDDVRDAVRADSDIEREFLRAIHLQRFELYLQPQVRCDDGRCDSAEALLRWQREDGQWVAPPDVFEIAGRLNQQGLLTRMLVARIARMADELDRSGVPVRVMLNLTADDLHDPELPDLVEQAMANWRVPAGRIGFELTEGAVLTDDPVVETVLTRLRALGATVALDDFGTGYSSLAHLRRLAVDELKIDRQFVAGMHAGPRDSAIVEAVLALARAFGLTTVAEGVEQAEQAETLTRMGCLRLQGMHFSPAIPSARFVSWWLARQGDAHPLVD
ncbi:EAL domain-containing protein [Nitrogeniibacter mangrovi]|uniref:EAL domain-containing protein n=1 Tax=Nitrogeniibacter mangrovi TaxID=2016596 RepID=A0A6C1B5G1_9RHOO|nr:GGDEF domain-containing phosphodiesterase [Nitrogeniibacter mangrovi]QID18707.1 EAL domain-containing protein [Nitrogeniibacter mangrovi]